MSNRIAVSIASATALIALACSTATEQAVDSPCVLSSSDSVYLADGPVFRDCSVDVAARRLNRNLPLNYRPERSTARGITCLNADLEFVVAVTGTPESKTARILRTNDGDFATAVIANIANWKYEPGKKNGIAVRQIVRERQVMAITAVRVEAGRGGPPPSPPACR